MNIKAERNQTDFLEPHNSYKKEHIDLNMEILNISNKIVKTGVWNLQLASKK